MHNFIWWMKDHPISAKILILFAIVTLPIWILPVGILAIINIVYEIITTETN